MMKPRKLLTMMLGLRKQRREIAENDKSIGNLFFALFAKHVYRKL